MNRKEYVRGLGLGILITAVIFTFFKPETKSMTEEEIIQYAVSLGYEKVEKQEKDPISNLDDIKSQAMGTGTPTPTLTPVPTLTLTPEPTNAPTPTLTPTPEPTSTPTPTLTPTPKPTNTPMPMPTSTPTPKPTSTPTLTPTPKPTEVPDVTPTSEPTAAPEVSVTPAPDAAQTETMYTLVVTDGMTATAVAKVLADNGVIEDDMAFVLYLRRQKLTHYILTGSYQIPYGASFKEIATAITIAQ